MRRSINSSLLASLVATSLMACVGGTTGPGDPTGPSDPVGGDPEQLASGGTGNTFDHDFDSRDPFDILQQQQTEGSPLVATRLHSCQKMSYNTLGNILSSLGVDLTNNAGGSAGQLYKSGGQALGAPNYLARTREPTQNTAAGATKMMDVFVEAAPEIIANMPTAAACMVNGQPTSMFDGNGQCVAAGVSCLLGAPASPQQVALCNKLITDASTQQIGQQMAVAVILSAAHTCE